VSLVLQPGPDCFLRAPRNRHEKTHHYHTCMAKARSLWISHKFGLHEETQGWRTRHDIPMTSETQPKQRDNGAGVSQVHVSVDTVTPRVHECDGLDFQEATPRAGYAAKVPGPVRDVHLQQKERSSPLDGEQKHTICRSRDERANPLSACKQSALLPRAAWQMRRDSSAPISTPRMQRLG
jgi:hypothetical protein